MLAPKYSISDFPPTLFIYIFAEIGAVFLTGLIRRLLYGGEREKWRRESCSRGHSPSVIGLLQMDIGFRQSGSNSGGKV